MISMVASLAMNGQMNFGTTVIAFAFLSPELLLNIPLRKNTAQSALACSTVTISRPASFRMAFSVCLAIFSVIVEAIIIVLAPTSLDSFVIGFVVPTIILSIFAAYSSLIGTRFINPCQSFRSTLLCAACLTNPMQPIFFRLQRMEIFQCSNDVSTAFSATLIALWGITYQYSLRVSSTIPGFLALFARGIQFVESELMGIEKLFGCWKRIFALRTSLVTIGDLWLRSFGTLLVNLIVGIPTLSTVCIKPVFATRLLGKKLIGFRKVGFASLALLLGNALRGKRIHRVLNCLSFSSPCFWCCQSGKATARSPG